MPSFEVEVDFEVWCAECGAGLCNVSETSTNSRGRHVKVQPCEKCLEAARDEADEKGYDRGYQDGQEATA